MKRFFLACLFTLGLVTAAAAAEVTSGGTPDPCNSVSLKQSVVIEASSATTAALVSVSGSKTVYVCGFAMSIAGSATTAASAKLIQGTGATCGSNAADLTGAFGSNDAAVSTTPTVVSYGDGNSTVISTSAGFAVCLTTAGNAVLTQGVLTYVQQNAFLPQ